MPMQPLLRGLGLENFRVFADYQWFDFAPITILTGPNSSGKSSILKALLLMKDNFSLFTSLSAYQNRLDFGGPSHFLSSGKNVLNPAVSQDSFLFDLPYDGGPYAGGLLNYGDAFIRYEFSVSEKSTIKQPGFKLINKRGESILQFHSNVLYFNLKHFLEIIQNDPNLLLKNISKKPRLGGNKRAVSEFERNVSFLSENFWEEGIVKFRTEEYNFEKEDIETNIKVGYSPNLKHMHYDEVNIFTSLFLLFKKKYQYIEISTKQLEELCNFVMDVLFFNIRTGVGITHDGEILDTNHFSDSNTLQRLYYSIRNLSYLPSIKGQSLRLYHSSDNSTLSQLIKDYLSGGRYEHEKIFKQNWEKLFNLSPIVVERNDDLDANFISIGNKSLTDQGFGITQISAVILQMLIARTNSILLLEEPEANLHPKFQSNLANLFCDAINPQLQLRHQLIIETHSEYMIRKFQYLVAKGEMKPEDIVIRLVAKLCINNLSKNSKVLRKFPVFCHRPVGRAFASDWTEPDTVSCLQFHALRPLARS